MKCSLDISNFLEEISSLPQSVVFHYFLALIAEDYTIEVTNRFKGLDLVDRVPEELWMEVHNFMEAVIKTILK